MTRPSIVSIGEVLWDLFPDGEKFGGAPANFACHAAIQGADVAMVSAVGNDRRGRDAVGVLTSYGLDISLVQSVQDAPTGAVSVELDKHGKPTFTIHDNSAWDCISWNDQIAARVAPADAVYFGTLSQRSSISRETILRAVDTAAAAGVTRILDINLRPPFFDAELIRESIHRARILKLSDEELGEVCLACGIAESDEPAMTLRKLRETMDLELLVMTCGADGAIAVSTDGTITQEGIATKVVDTVGAGDSFAAAFLIGHLLGKPHEDNLRRACEVAAAACSHPGAVPAVQRTEQGLL